MATVSAKVFAHHQKLDGTFNVKICLCHKRVRKYIDTVHYVSRRQLDGRYHIKDNFLNRIIESSLDKYRETISQLDSKLQFFSCGDLLKYLEEKEIDFIKFCTDHIAQLRKENRNGTANTHRTVRNSLIDYFERESVSINEIHSKMLYAYARYLKSKRTIVRKNQFGKEVKTQEEGLSESGLHNHMRDLRTLFNAACAQFNNEDLGLYRVKHYPFKRYKVGRAPLTKKRNITIEQVKLIRDCQVKPGSRAELAKDLFMLSFYLCGMNAVDLYHLREKDITKRGRINYNRAKTQGRRTDKAFISIKLIDEANPILTKYLGTLSERYKTYDGLDTALSAGMQKLRELTDIEEITFYWARHTFANTARNDCRMSMDDVALALNHIDEGHRTTDIYIAKDWKIVDEVQEKVVKMLK
jgi:integrase